MILKSKKRFIGQMLTLFLLIFWAGFAYGNSVKILAPKNGERVGARVIVKGTSKITDGSHIWVLAHLKLLKDQWWPQPKPVVDDKNDWQALIYLGGPQDVGMEFEIAVATFNKDVEAKILRYHEYGQKTGQFIPMPFPKTTSPIYIVTVKKVSH